MDAARWAEVRALFEATAERPEADRAARLAGVEAALRREVEALLAAHDDETPFLDAPLVAALPEPPAEAPRGTRLGPYRLVREIGRGGMGVVHLAERADGAFEREVAVKLVRLGGLDGDLVRRFERERRVLAGLNHPGIARLLDGGVSGPLPGAPEGVPYLAMEYVAGEPITAFADRHRLSVPERIALFRSVCDAVQYAHQRLVVHRDLKPSNVLVGQGGRGAGPGAHASADRRPAPRVKLLDFGVATLLADDGEAATLTTPLLTPAYAAPEQIRGGTVTTATDVYALGVLLYELLTGRRPYDLRGLSPGAVERAVCETAPPAPSDVVREGGDARARAERRGATPDALRRRLRGDLDTIVATALRKDPARRYATAAALADDLARHLARLPVRARPDTLAYRAAAFVRRHTAGVAATVLVALALVGGLAAATHQARIAERRVASLRALSNTLLSDVHDGIRDLPGATPARRTLVASALGYLDALYREGRTEPALQFDLAAAFEQIGEVQGNPHYTNLGDLEGATESYRRAFELRAALWARDSTDDRLRQALANSYGHLAVVLGWRGGDDDVAAMRRRALALLAPLADRPAPDPSVLHDAARIRSEHGWGLVWDGRYDDGLAHLDTALAVFAALAEAAPDDLGLALHRWRALSYRADGLSFAGRDADLLALVEADGLPLLHGLERAHPRHPRVQYGLHMAYEYLGRARRRLARPGVADAYGTSLRYAEAMGRDDPTNRKGEEATQRALGALASVHAEAGRTDAALAALGRARALARRRYDADRDNAEAGNKLASVLRATCRTLADADRLAEALGPCEASAEVQRGVVERSASGVSRGNLGAAYGHTARIHRALAGRAPDEAGRRAHRAEALRWYRLGTTTLAAVQAETDAADPAWEVDPDALRAEYAALRAEAD